MYIPAIFWSYTRWRGGQRWWWVGYPLTWSRTIGGRLCSRGWDCGRRTTFGRWLLGNLRRICWSRVGWEVGRSNWGRGRRPCWWGRGWPIWRATGRRSIFQFRGNCSTWTNCWLTWLPTQKWWRCRRSRCCRRALRPKNWTSSWIWPNWRRLSVCNWILWRRWCWEWPGKGWNRGYFFGLIFWRFCSIPHKSWILCSLLSFMGCVPIERSRVLRWLRAV